MNAKLATMTGVKTVHSEIASYRRKVINTKSRWIGHSKIYTVKFLTCGGTTCTRYRTSTLCREIAGKVKKADKNMKN